VGVAWVGGREEAGGGDAPVRRGGASREQVRVGVGSGASSLFVGIVTIICTSGQRRGDTPRPSKSLYMCLCCLLVL
jgi:hypothetical protein